MILSHMRETKEDLETLLSGPAIAIQTGGGTDGSLNPESPPHGKESAMLPSRSEEPRGDHGVGEEAAETVRGGPRPVGWWKGRGGGPTRVLPTHGPGCGLVKLVHYLAHYQHVALDQTLCRGQALSRNG